MQVRNQCRGMGSMGTRIPSRKVNAALHAVALRRDFPGSRVEVGPGYVRWVGELQPTPLSERYRVQIECRGERRPVVTVLSPPLILPEGKDRFEHVFPGDHPCVHYPHDWTPEMLIANTILPWVSEWLLNYELWHTTKKWLGGGHEPSRGPKRESTAALSESRPATWNEHRNRRTLC